MIDRNGSWNASPITAALEKILICKTQVAGDYWRAAASTARLRRVLRYHVLQSTVEAVE